MLKTIDCVLCTEVDRHVRAGLNDWIDERQVGVRKIDVRYGRRPEYVVVTAEANAGTKVQLAELFALTLLLGAYEDRIRLSALRA